MGMPENQMTLPWEPSFSVQYIYDYIPIDLSSPTACPPTHDFIDFSPSPPQQNDQESSEHKHEVKRQQDQPYEHQIVSEVSAFNSKLPLTDFEQEKTNEGQKAREKGDLH